MFARNPPRLAARKSHTAADLPHFGRQQTGHPDERRLTEEAGVDNKHGRRGAVRGPSGVRIRGTLEEARALRSSRLRSVDDIYDPW